MLSIILHHKAGEDDDTKGMPVFLSSKASDYMTVAVIPTDEGMAAK